MKKQDLINILSKKLECNKTKTNEILNHFLETIEEAIKSNPDSFRIANLGTFITRKRPERQGKNPKTGEAITIKARKDIYFRASKQLKESINDRVSVKS